MISSLEVRKAETISPIYLKGLLKLCRNFIDQSEYIRNQGEYIMPSDIGRLFELGYVILEEYLGLVNQMKSNEKELMDHIRNDVFSTFSQFYNKSGKGDVTRVDWYKIIGSDNSEAMAQQVISSIKSFIESRIYLPLIQTHKKLMAEEMFLNQMITISVRKEHFFPDLAKKPGDIDALLGGDDDKEHKKKKKKEKDESESE